MSHSPATPHKSGQCANGPSPKSAKPSEEKLRSISKSKQASLYEPSPASTYGDTAGSSMPATPQGMVLNNPSSGEKYTLAATSIHPAFEGLYISSPAGGRGRNSSTHSTRQAVRSALLDYPTPSKKQVAGGRVFSSSTSSKSSLHSDRLRQSWRSPEHDTQPPKQGAESFVQRSGNAADDVFSSSNNNRQQPIPGSLQPGETNEAISNDNAQALLPPSACVFVANLTQTQTDEQLEHHVQEAFCQFGICYVKIRRDSNGMPFAFVQYKTEEDAQRAITLGRGMHINNRPCRTEVAKVNRSLYLSRVTGGHISEAEAREALSPYGEIEKVWYSSPTESEIFRLPEGIWVMYKLFQPSRDAQSNFRDHAHYRLEQPPMAEEFRSRFRPRHFQSSSPLAARQNPGRSFPSPLRRATAVDLRSIFVGNLPASINKDQIAHMFGIYGFILDIEIVQKPSANIIGVNTFAFIEYSIPEGALAAIQASPKIYGNFRLRVERRESIDPSSRFNTFMSPRMSPHSQFMGDSQDQMAISYQRGLFAGLSQAAQAPTMPPPYWPGYQYVQPYDASQYHQYAAAPAHSSENNVAPDVQNHPNDYAAQPMNQVHYTYQPASYVPYVQHPPHQYQWPTPGYGGDHAHGSPSKGI